MSISPQTGFQNSNEKVTLRSLRAIHTAAEQYYLRYALFGGAGIAAYAGHLTRRLHDIDYVVPSVSRTEWLAHFHTRSLIERRSPKSLAGNFQKFDELVDASRITHTLFPEAFRLINIDSPDMNLLFEFDLSVALERRVLRSLRSLDNSISFETWVIPIEDLLLTKLFPATEPNTVYDVAVLLSTNEDFNLDYFASRLASIPGYTTHIANNARRILSFYEKSVWSRMVDEKWLRKIGRLLDSLSVHGQTKSLAQDEHHARLATVLSHGPDCLDGVAAASCVARAYGSTSVSVHFTHPSEIDQLMQNISLDRLEPQDLWITDISWKTQKTEELLRRLTSKGWRVFWVDHHSNALERASRGLDDLHLTGYRVTAEYSAARLTYQFLLDTRPFSGPATPLLDFEHIVMLADDADRWINKLSGSRDLALIVAAMGADAYRELLKIESADTLTPAMEDALANSKRRLRESIEIALQTRLRRSLPGGVTVVGCICRGYASEVADRLRADNNRALFVIYNSETRKISLRRSPDCDIDCAQIASMLNGGGHPAAAGFDLPELDGMITSTMINVVAEALIRMGAPPTA